MGRDGLHVGDLKTMSDTPIDPQDYEYLKQHWFPVIAGLAPELSPREVAERALEVFIGIKYRLEGEAKGSHPDPIKIGGRIAYLQNGRITLRRN